MRLENKVAIVTGAASGFGAEIARVFAREGAKAAVLDINGEGAGLVAREIGPAAIAITADVTKRADIEGAVRRTLDAFGRIDIVVNNAGWSHKNRPMLEVSEDEFDRVYAINVKSIYHMAHAVVPAGETGRRRHHQYRLDRGDPSEARVDLV
jgi:3-oxoacyl-[acyl-carrier protein] reductase